MLVMRDALFFFGFWLFGKLRTEGRRFMLCLALFPALFAIPRTAHEAVSSEDSSIPPRRA